jgi:hypothetical protein
MSLADVQIMLIFALHEPESRHKSMYSTKGTKNNVKPQDHSEPGAG